MTDDDFAEQTCDPVKANERNFYKVEAWDAAGHITALLHAGNRLDRAIEVLDAEIRHRPAARLTIRQRARVLRKWPQDSCCSCRLELYKSSRSREASDLRGYSLN
jgi:hypothetical protein